ncbi:MAG: hypothetical protein ACP5MG_05030 [Verrucomicrobiia bacterium]
MDATTVYEENFSKFLNKEFTFKRFALFLAIAIFLCYPTVLCLQGTFMHRDYSAFGYPLAAYNRDCFWRGEIPLWNPYNVCGIPYLAQWNTQFLYPPALFYLIFPTQWALGVFNILHMYFAGLGMYLLVRKWTKNNFAAAVGGIAYAFSGLIQYALMWPNDVATLAWAPWLILSVENALKQGGKYIVAAIVIGAFQMLSGFPEGIILNWFLIGILPLFVWLPEKWNETTQQPDNNQNYTVFQTNKFIITKNFLARFILIIIGITAISVVQLAPFYDLLIHSDRHSDYGKSYWSMPWYGWANLILPLFYCFPASDAVFHQYDQQWTGSYYSGLAVFVLAMAVIYKIRLRLIGILSIVLAFSLVMALGDNGYLYKWVRTTFPFIGFMRFPVKFVVLSTIIFPVLSAFGIKYLVEGQFKQIIKPIIGFTISAIISIGLLLLIEFKYPQIYDVPETVLANGLTRVGLLLLTLFFIYSLIPEKKISRWGYWIIIIFFWVDLAYHSPKMSPVVNKSVYNPGNNKLLHSQNPPALGLRRVMIDPYLENYIAHFTVPTNTSIEPNLRRELAYANANLIDKIPKIDGMFSLYPKAIGNMVIRMYWAGQRFVIPDESLDFLSVGYIVGSNLVWNYRSNAMPFITAGQKPLFIDTVRSKMEAMLLHDLKYKDLIFIPAEAYSNSFVRTPGKAEIKLNKFTAHLIDFDVDAKDPVWIVINQTYYHHWKCYIDSVRKTIWEADSAFCAVESDRGSHRVILIYDDIYFKIGLIISSLTIILITIILINRPKVRII